MSCTRRKETNTLDIGKDDDLLTHHEHVEEGGGSSKCGMNFVGCYKNFTKNLDGISVVGKGTWVLKNLIGTLLRFWSPKRIWQSPEWRISMAISNFVSQLETLINKMIKTILCIILTKCTRHRNLHQARFVNGSRLWLDTTTSQANKAITWCLTKHDTLCLSKLLVYTRSC